MSDRKDHITRKEAIKILKSAKTDKYFGTSEQLIEAWDMAINSLEVDEAYQLEYEKSQSNWIPVTERLPKPFMFVNATCRSLVDDREDWVVETVYLPIPKEANKHGYSDWGNIPILNWGQAEVIAWMERIIPEPYNADSNSEKPNKSEKSTSSITFNELEEIREEINNLQTYKLFSGDTELYLSKDDVKAILDKRISELEGKEKEDAYH